MKMVDIGKLFGNVLSTRDLGKKSFFLLEKDILTLKDGEFLLLDFSHVNLVNPSYIDELVVQLYLKYSDKVKVSKETRLDIKHTIDFLMKPKGFSIDYV